MTVELDDLSKNTFRKGMMCNGWIEVASKDQKEYEDFFSCDHRAIYFGASWSSANSKLIIFLRASLRFIYGIFLAVGLNLVQDDLLNIKSITLGH